MCLTAPVRVISVEEGMATVEVAGVRRLATTLALPEVRPGDWALMTAGTLVRILDPALAAELEAAYRTATGETS
jgi:hydrogenase expression/formation protein HypC